MSENKEKTKVLFLCTGNSCRSRMAQGWAKHLKTDIIEALSAVVQPAGLSSSTVKVMAEAGVDISDHISKHIDDDEIMAFIETVPQSLKRPAKETG